VKVGDLVYDTSISKNGMIIKTGIYWTDTDGVTHWWDYEVLYSDGKRAYADIADLFLAEEAPK